MKLFRKTEQNVNKGLEEKIFTSLRYTLKDSMTIAKKAQDITNNMSDEVEYSQIEYNISFIVCVTPKDNSGEIATDELLDMLVDKRYEFIKSMNANKKGT